MICSLLIMTMFFVNGLVNAEQKVKHSGSILREEEMNPKTKAWWLMVESGKVDQEDLKRITPKSIFIAPLLTNRAGKCKEGYSHDHLGQCVKIIKIDPKAQLEALLKRLNMLYSEKKREGEEEDDDEDEDESPAQGSNEPLHISIPIQNEGDKKQKQDESVPPEMAPVNVAASNSESLSEFLPIPMPKLCFNDTDLFNRTNQDKEMEASGLGPLNNTDPCDTMDFEGSGFSSVTPSPSTMSTPFVSVISEEIDYLDFKDSTTSQESTTADPMESTEVQWKAEIESHTFTTTERYVGVCTTTLASNNEESKSEDSYQSVTNVPSVNDGVDIAKKSEVVKNNPESDRIHFPSDDEVRTRVNPQFDVSYIRFPDDSVRERPSYQSPSSFSNWNSQYQVHPSAIPRQQFWWLPENWKVDENQQKSTLVKFWSRMPLVHDVSYAEDHGEGVQKPFPARQPQLQLVNSLRRNHDFPLSFNHPPRAVRRGKPFRSNRFQDSVAVPRQTFRIQR